MRLLTPALVLLFVLACSASPTSTPVPTPTPVGPGIAARVAEAWTNGQATAAADEMVGLVIDEVSIVATLATNILAEVIRDNLDWTFSTPTNYAEDRYEVIATAVAEASIDAPLVGKKAYLVSLPFKLSIDTDAQTVIQWVPDVLEGSVEETSE